MSEEINYPTAKYLYELLDPWVAEVKREFGDEWGYLVDALHRAAHAYLAVDDTRSFQISQWVLDEIGEAAVNNWWDLASDAFYYRLRRLRLLDRPSTEGIRLTGDAKVAFEGFVEAFKTSPEWMQPTEEDKQANTLLDHPQYERWLQVEREYQDLAKVFGGKV